MDGELRVRKKKYNYELSLTFEDGTTSGLWSWLLRNHRRKVLRLGHQEPIGARQLEKFSNLKDVDSLHALLLSEGDAAPPILIRAKAGTGKTWSSQQLVRLLAKSNIIDEQEKATHPNEGNLWKLLQNKRLRVDIDNRISIGIRKFAAYPGEFTGEGVKAKEIHEFMVGPLRQRHSQRS